MVIAIAALVLNVFHPGWCFPKKYENEGVSMEKDAETKGDESSSEV